MKTTNQLMEGIDYVKQSVSYGESRVILNHLDDPVIAYARWFGGFIIIIKDHHKFLHAYTYACKRPLANFKDAVFEKVEINDAIKFLKQDKEGIIEKEFDEVDVREIKKRFERPMLGSFKYEEKNNNWNKGTIRFVRKKDGMLRAETTGWNGSFNRIEMIDALNHLKKDKDGEKYEITENTIPKEIIKEIESSVIADEL